MSRLDDEAIERLARVCQQASAVTSGETPTTEKPAQPVFQTLPAASSLPHLAELRPGACVGRFVITKPLGRGGAGSVYAAHDSVLQREVALKIVARQHRSAELWLVEARSLARLQHPHVITVFDAGTFGDAAYVAMELVRGGTLRAWLGGRGRSWSELRQLFVQIAEALASSHELGIVHCDVKPDNVLVDGAGSPHVVDFGLARTFGQFAMAPAHASDAVMGSGSASPRWVGTPGYVAPEVARGAPADPRSDQFSYCVMLVEALTGVSPWTLLSPSSPSPPPQALLTAVDAGACPDSLRHVLREGLAEDPHARHASMRALLEHLTVRSRRRLFLGAAMVGIGVVTAAAAAVFTSGTRNGTSLERTRPRHRSWLASAVGPVAATATLAADRDHVYLIERKMSPSVVSFSHEGAVVGRTPLPSLASDIVQDAVATQGQLLLIAGRQLLSVANGGPRLLASLPAYGDALAAMPDGSLCIALGTVPPKLIQFDMHGRQIRELTIPQDARALASLAATARGEILALTLVEPHLYVFAGSGELVARRRVRVTAEATGAMEVPITDMAPASGRQVWLASSLGLRRYDYARESLEAVEVNIPTPVRVPVRLVALDDRLIALMSTGHVVTMPT